MNAIEELLRGHIRSCREAGEEYARRIDALEALTDRLSSGSGVLAQPTARRQPNGWSEDENALLREHYQVIGAKGCAGLLPHRSQMAIRNQAGKLRLTKHYISSRHKKRA